MGYFTRLKTSGIMPREFSFPRSEARFIYLSLLIGAYLERDEESLFPPAVKMANEKWVTVDGHNRLLVADLFTGESNVYVPSHKLDVFTEEMAPGVHEFMRKDLNGTIERMFDLADIVNYLGGESFSELRQRKELGFLKDIESARRFYEEWKSKVASSSVNR